MSMTNLEREELSNRIKALGPEEREVVIASLPVNELMLGIIKAYSSLSDKYERIKSLVNNM